MSIRAYKKEVSKGVFKTFYKVRVEAINRYTLKRVQKFQSLITSKARAEFIHRELWSQCRERKPSQINFKTWGELVFRYKDSITEKIRSAIDPLGFSPQVVKTKESILKHTALWNAMAFELISPQFVTDELDKLESKSVSRSTTNHILKEVRCVFSFAVTIGALQANPFSNCKMRRMPRKKQLALNHEEVKILLNEASKRNHPYFYIWLITISLGLRRSELAGLQWSDVDFKNRLIHLQRQFIPGEGLVDNLKSGHGRIVAVPDFLIPELQKLKLQTTGDFVISVKCQSWRSGHQAKVLRAFCREIGLKEVTHHQLRATHITLALVDNIPLGIVKANVGHSKLSTTDRYFREAGINMRGQMDGLRVELPTTEKGIVLPLKVMK